MPELLKILVCCTLFGIILKLTDIIWKSKTLFVIYTHFLPTRRNLEI